MPKKKSKTKPPKPRREKFEVEGKIIDMQRFAYDMIRYSFQIFQVEDSCIEQWDGEENEYVLPNFIPIMSRSVIHNQILNRQSWFEQFSIAYMGKRIRYFGDVARALPEMIQFMSPITDKRIDFGFFITLSFMSELGLFLYMGKVGLPISCLAVYWSELWMAKQKLIQRRGGLSTFYHLYNNAKEEQSDLFCKGFIAANLATYTVGTELKEKFYAEYRIHMGTTHREMLARLHEAKEEPSHAKPAPSETQQEGDEASGGAEIPVNPGLGIPMHEDLLRDMGIPIPEAGASGIDQPSTSHQRTPAGRRVPTRKKGTHKRSTAQISEDFERLEIGSSTSEQPREQKE